MTEQPNIEMGTHPKVSVIIPMYNARKTIRNCVKSVLASDYPDFEIIVVNDASIDASEATLSDLRCRLVNLEQNCGQGAARNEAVKIASGKLLVFTDADCEVPRNWLSKIVENFADYDIGAVSGGYSKSMNNDLIALFQFHDICFRQRNVSQYVNSVCGPNFACKKEVFEKTDGFPSDCGNEDMQIGIAISRLHKILWDGNNGVFHYFSNNFRRFFTRHILWADKAAELYISSPKIILEKTRWDTLEIFHDLFAAGFLYLSGIAALLNPALTVVFFASLAFYLGIKIKFIRFVAKKEGYRRSFKTLPLLFIKDTACLWGVCKAIFRHLWKRFRRF